MNYIEVLKELINKEMSFIDLDNFMEGIGYYSVLDDNSIIKINDIDRYIEY